MSDAGSWWVEVPLDEVVHLLDADGDVFIERAPDRFQVPHALPEHNSYSLDAIIGWWGLAEVRCLIFWGSHGCDRPVGHQPPHRCGDPRDLCSEHTGEAVRYRYGGGEWSDWLPSPNGTFT